MSFGFVRRISGGISSDYGFYVCQFPKFQKFAHFRTSGSKVEGLLDLMVFFFRDLR